MKVLIIDDDSSLRQTLRDTLEEKGDWKVEDQGFECVDDALIRFRPDMVVLDLVKGEPPDEVDTGNVTFERIRDIWFCPTVIYSAFPHKQNFDHPLTKTIEKGADRDLEVRDYLEDFVPEAKIIRSVHQDFDSRIREALRDSVHALRDQIVNTEDDSNDPILLRAVRRLVAARVDVAASGEGNLRAWERFVVPPLGDHLLTADLLRRKDADWKDPEAFRLVLTPSCDLVPRNNGRPTAERVLLARCERFDKLGKVELKTGTGLTNKQRDSLRSMLTEGMADNHFPIPGFQGCVPLMVANLKRLELIEWDKIELELRDGQASTTDVEFTRVVSTDSPFREMVVWAYLRVAGRPGVPVIDVDGWLDDISGFLDTSGQT